MNKTVICPKVLPHHHQLFQHVLFSGNIVKEYEDDIPFDGNGVINPRKSVNEDKGIQFRGIVSDDSRNDRSDDEGFPVEGSGTNDSLIFPNDPR